MTISDIHTLLCSRSFYEKNGSKKLRFSNNALAIDRRAATPFSLYEEQGHCFINISNSIFPEKDLRIEWQHSDGGSFRFYGKETGLEALVIE